jgi:uncharacterized membrane protein
MPQRGWVASAALLSVIVIFTIFAVRARSEPVLMGSFALFLLPAVLTIYLLVLLYSARAIMDLLASFLLGRREEVNARGKSWMTIIGYAIGAILIIVLIRSVGLLRIMEVVETTLTAVSSALKIGQGLPAQATAAAPSPYLLYYILLIIAAIVLVSFTLLIGGIRTAYRWAHEENPPLTPGNVRQETLRVVQRAAKGLRLTDDYRATILNCYREMCRVLSVHGFQTELYETASEFSRTVSDKLGLGGESVRGLTLLFEEARYSDHRIDNAKRAEALNQLESLEHSLGNASS